MNEISNNEDIEDQGMVVYQQERRTICRIYETCVTPVFDPANETVWDGSYLLRRAIH